MTFVFRNNTIERFMPDDYQFSGYDDISYIPNDAQEFVWWYQVPLKFDSKSLTEEIESYVSKLNLVLTTIGKKPIIVFTLTDNLFCNQIVTSDNSVKKAINDFNSAIYDIAHRHSNVRVIDISLFTKAYKDTELIDWKMYMLSQTPINPKLANEFRVWYSSGLRAIRLQRKKCLILDLDNTLWSGILGEDGVNNILLSGSYPGKAFHLWQQGLKELKNKGVILCICSKNNRQDVDEVWNKRDDMVLKRDDFAALRVNWQDKATNIVEIAKELNIGLDSIVFVDDNPTERELVKQILPEVEVPEFPKQPYELPILLNNLICNYFQIYTLTDEDKSKTEQYISNAKREEEKMHYANIEDYLRSLELVLSIAPIKEQTLVRSAALTQKTNQFNLTTKRYEVPDIERMLANGARGWTLSVDDKFGDYGITGLIIIDENNEIDTMLMSCRVLGKGIESVFLRTVLKLLKDNNIKTVKAQYLPTAKNAQTSHFYDNNGFSLVCDNAEGKLYEIDLQKSDIIINDLFTIRM